MTKMSTANESRHGPMERFMDPHVHEALQDDVERYVTASVCEFVWRRTYLSMLRTRRQVLLFVTLSARKQVQEDV